MTPHEKKCAVRDALVVDTDEPIGRLLLNAMRRAGLTWETSIDGLNSFERSVRENVVLPDLLLSDLDGTGFVEWLAEFDRTSNEGAVVPIMKSSTGVERLPVTGDLVQADIRESIDSRDLRATPLLPRPGH